MIVECLTDNRSRTEAEIRVLFNDGHLDAIGSVTWKFDHVDVVEAPPNAAQNLETAAIEAGAQNVGPTTNNVHRVYAAMQ